MKLRQMKLRLLLVERLFLPGFWGSGMSTGRSENTACVPKVPDVCVLGQGVVAGMPAHLVPAGGSIGWRPEVPGIGDEAFYERD
tara:strand:+ start:11689 stop:11940 length:252 start_codon:yes stop_codon:yes gene_type:complete